MAAETIMHSAAPFGLCLALAGVATVAASDAQATPAKRVSSRDAAYLEAAFGHDLCTRNDRALRKLNAALNRTPTKGTP